LLFEQMGDHERASICSPTIDPTRSATSDRAGVRARSCRRPNRSGPGAAAPRSLGARRSAVRGSPRASRAEQTAHLRALGSSLSCGRPRNRERQREPSASHSRVPVRVRPEGAPSSRR
jgi:hypothetical protein